MNQATLVGNTITAIAADGHHVFTLTLNGSGSWTFTLLAPLDDAFAFAQVQSFNNYLCATVHVAHAHKGRGYRWASDEATFADMKRMVPKSMAGAFGLIEKGMLKGPWVMGEQYTVCDPYLYTVAIWLEGDSVELKTLPRVADHMKRMSERPAVQKVMGEQQAKAA